MDNFKKALIEALESNRLESLVPSREYTENEQIYMRGYTQALEDMLEDFEADFPEFMKNTYTFSLN